MNKEFLQRWSTALRSGKYKQGTHYLRDRNDNFCCLGVACDLLVDDGMLRNWRRSSSSFTIHGEKAMLPIIAARMLGTNALGGYKNTKTPLSKDGREFDSLSQANDCGMSFTEIADFLDKLAEEA